MATTYELIDSVTLGSNAASVTFSSIPGTYDDLVILSSIRSDRSANADSPIVKFNGSSSSYSVRYLNGNGSSASSSTDTTIYLYAPAATASGNTFSNDEIYIPDYAGSQYKSATVTTTREDNATNSIMSAQAVLWSSTSAITSVGFTPWIGPNFVTGSSFYLYGVKNSDDGSQGYFGFAAKGGDEVFVTGDGYKVHVFKTSGTLEVTSPGEVECLVVAGGGGGGIGVPASNIGSGAGGGAGGLIYENKNIESSIYSVLVGAGGVGGISSGITWQTSGSNSILSDLTAIGGGSGGSYDGTGSLKWAPGTGGSGGGGAYSGVNGASGISGQGNSGGNCGIAAPEYGNGGGGGAGSAGSDGSGSKGGNGGTGRFIFNSYYSGGGGGAPGGGGGSSATGLGGQGGGGDSGLGSIRGSGSSGTANTGGGAGGGANDGAANGGHISGNGGNGGSGIVIIRYKV